jgi:tetratricopeptide (TPR) repeat protein
MLAPHHDAPILMPAHVDILCQTAPHPVPDVDVPAYLHGVGRGEPEVRVAFRVDIAGVDGQLRTDEESRAAYSELLALCPPKKQECLGVPMSRLKKYLLGQSARPAPADEDEDVEGAVRQLDESIAFFRAEKAPRALALALLRRAEIVGFRADYARARALLGEARDLCLRIGDGALEAETLNNLGYLEYELGHLSRSRDLCARALAVAEVAGSASGVLMATGNLGVVHRELGQIRAAASYQRDAADLAHQNHLRQDLCYALGNLGACYQDVGQWEDARACVRTAYRLANDLHDARALSIIANLMAEQFSQTGHDGLADGWWALALSVAKAFGMPRHVAWYAGAWAEVLLNAGRTAEAAVVLREGWPRRRWARDVERLGLRAQYVRWAYAVGRLSADQARRRLLEACQATKDVQALAVGQYVTWQVSGRLDDRRTAQASVNAVLATHPQVRWQKYGLTLGADVLRLPALEPPPVWLELEAPTDDCDPEPVWLGRWASRRLDLGPDGPPDRAEGR